MEGVDEMKKVVLASGGLDSFILWYLFCKDSLNCFVNINQKYSHKERTAVRNLKKEIPEYKLVEIDGASIGQFEDEQSGIIPNRNAELILTASQFGNEIYFGVLKDEIEKNDNTSDKSPDFIDAMMKVLNISNKKQAWTNGTQYKVCTPSVQYNKTELLTKYLDAGGNPEHLFLTISCYSDTEKHCGECPSCFGRYVAFTNNQLPFETIKSPIEWAEKKTIVSKCSEGYYTEDKTKELKMALNL